MKENTIQCKNTSVTCEFYVVELIHLHYDEITGKDKV